MRVSVAVSEANAGVAVYGGAGDGGGGLFLPETSNAPKGEYVAGEATSVRLRRTK